MSDKEFKVAEAEFSLLMMAVPDGVLDIIAAFVYEMGHFKTTRGGWHFFKANILGRTKELEETKNDLLDDLERIKNKNALNIKLLLLMQKNFTEALEAEIKEIDLRLQDGGRASEASREFSSLSLNHTEEGVKILKRLNELTPVSLDMRNRLAS